MHRSLLAVLAAMTLSSIAYAVPMQFVQQGRVFDSSGVPITGVNTLDFAIYDTSSGGTAVWTESHSIDADEGYYSVQLGSTATLDSAMFDGDELYLGVAINGGAELSERIRLLAVPYAVRAGQADQATDVSGGVVDATEVRINGTTVIGTDGTIDTSALPAGDDTLASLTCGSGEVAVFDGTDWQCAANSVAHNHDAADIASGTVAPERIPFGTGPDTVAEGDHGHSDLLALTGGTLSGDLIGTNANFSGSVQGGSGSFSGPLSGTDGTFSGDVSGVAGDFSGDVSGADGTFSGDVSGVAGNFSGDVSGADGSFSGDVSGVAGDFSGDVSGADGAFSGDLSAGSASFGGSVQVGATTDACGSGNAGALRFVSATQVLEACIDGAWIPIIGGLTGSSSASAAVSCHDLHSDYPLFGDGIYWVDPDGSGGQAPFEAYCDMNTDGGGWTLVARMTVAGGQQHWNTGDVNLSGEVTRNAPGTEKFSDARINAIQAGSSYSGPTSYRMTCWEGQSFAQTMFCSSSCAFNATASVNTSECSRCTGTFEGSLVQLSPNTGTRGLGHHHDYTYAWSMAYQRHPEQGTNPGCRNDNRGSGDGHLWVK